HQFYEFVHGPVFQTISRSGSSKSIRSRKAIADKAVSWRIITDEHDCICDSARHYAFAAAGVRARVGKESNNGFVTTSADPGRFLRTGNVKRFVGRQLSCVLSFII